MPAVVLSDDVLNTLLARPDATGLPCLQFVKVTKDKSCNCVRSRGKTSKSVDGEHARVCVFQLPPERLADLKKTLNAEHLVLFMTTPGFPRRAVI